MSEQLARFLLSVSQDPILVEEFWSDPDRFLKDADLSEDDKAVLRTGEAERIRQHMGPQQWFSNTNISTQPPPTPKPPRPPKPPKH